MLCLTVSTTNVHASRRSAAAYGSLARLKHAWAVAIKNKQKKSPAGVMVATAACMYFAAPHHITCGVSNCCVDADQVALAVQQHTTTAAAARQQQQQNPEQLQRRV
jgi:hypothetical protein